MVEKKREDAQTQLLAILFVDQADSGRHIADLGEVAAGELGEQVQTILRGVVESHEGRVVKHLGGGLMAAFSGTSQALDSAIVMHQKLASAARIGDVSIAVSAKIGISAGDVTVSDGDCHGTAVVEAARLQSASPANGILCTGLTKLLSGGRSSAVFAAAEPVDAKGFDEPILAWSIGWEEAEHTGFAIPEGLGAGGRFGFVGRSEALGAARKLWESSLDGAVTGALIAGEPGVGKSRLARELGLEMVAAGALVLYGRCDEGLGVPFQPFVKALDSYVDAINGSDRPDGPVGVSDLGRFAGDLRRLSPELGDLVAGLPEALEADSDTEKYRLFDAVLSWLETAASSAPVVVVVDDFQWAAAPTLQLMRHILRSGSAARICVVGTYRDTEADNSEALTSFLADTSRILSVGTVTLQGLDRDGIRALLDVASVIDDLGLDENSADNLALRLLEQTAGNPFFLGELVAVVEESGIDGLDRSQTSALSEVVLDRIARLDPLASEILSLASTAGSSTGLDVIAVGLGLSRADVLDAIDQTLHAGLLVESTEPPIRYRFQHDLVRATVYEQMSLGRRSQRHHDVAKAIETVHSRDLDKHYDDLAFHYQRSQDPGDVDRAVEVCQLAGDSAVRGLAFDVAVNHYAAALEAFDHYGCTLPLETKGRLMLSLGVAKRKAGQRGARRLLLEAADEAASHGDDETVVHAALANSRGFFSSAGQTDTGRVRLLEMAIEAIDPQDSSHRARLLANLSVELTFGTELERRQALSDESLAMAERLAHPATMAHILNQRIGFFWSARGLPQRLELCERLRTVAYELELRQWTFSAASSQFQAAMEAGDLALADRCVNEMVRDAEELRQPVVESYLRMRQSVRSIVKGDLEEGERLAYLCYQLAESAGQPDALTFYAGQLFNLRFHQGRLGELEELFADAAANQAGIPAMQAALAVIYCETDQPEKAEPVYGELADRSGELLHDLSWLLTTSLLAESCWQLGDTPRSQALHEDLKAFRGQCVDNATNWFGSVSRYLGMLEHVLGSHDEADRSFAEAHDWHAAMPAPALLARTRLDWGRSLLERPEPEVAKATELLTLARSEAQRMGLGTIERRCGELLDFSQ